MPYQKKTLRKLPPQTRKVARLINELESATRRLKNLLPTIQDMEMWERAEMKRQAAVREEPEGRPMPWDS